MSQKRGRGRHARWVAAWAVACLLVFQAVLSSAAMLMPVAPGNVLCLGAETADGAAGHPDAGTPGALHCQACLARADTPDLAPPVRIPTIDRIAIELRYQGQVRAALRRFLPASAFQPRGPPSIRIA